MWVIMQTGYRTTDGSVYGYGTSHVGPTRKLMAVCRTEVVARKWLRRLNRWAADGVGQSYHATRIPTYEALMIAGLAGLQPASCVGPAYYGEHGREASLRAIVLGVRESHAALQWEARRRQQAAMRPGLGRSGRRRASETETDTGCLATAE
jgi:hypothetical protein